MYSEAATYRDLDNFLFCGLVEKNHHNIGDVPKFTLFCIKCERFIG